MISADWIIFGMVIGLILGAFLNRAGQARATRLGVLQELEQHAMYQLQSAPIVAIMYYPNAHQGEL